MITTEGIDCGWQRDGSLYLARTRPQEARLRSWQDMRLKLGITDLRMLSPKEVGQHVNVEGVLLGGFTPHCAAVAPAAIAAGLAQVLERRGVTIVERTRALSVGPGRVRTEHGTVRAATVLVATEAYTAGLSGHARRVLPVISRVLATEPLPPELWRRAGWRDRVTVADSRYQFGYFQRTADDRLIIGGRGAGYLAGSRALASRRYDERGLRPAAHLPRATIPGAGRRADHPSLEWCLRPASRCRTSGGLDPATGLGHAGGYGGEGIALSNLAGRTLAALVTGTVRAETRLCWAGHSGRRWEPEPLRLLGVRAVSGLASTADRYEDRFNRSAPLAGFVMRSVL